MERSPRHLLLPGWIRFFAWIYFAGGIIGLIVSAYLWVTEPTLSLKFNLFGQTYPGQIRSGWFAGSCALGLFMVFASYGMLWGRLWGRVVALLVCYAYPLVCVVSFFLKLRTGSVTVEPFQPFLFAVAIFSLHRLQRDWDAPPILSSTDGGATAQPMV